MCRFEARVALVRVRVERPSVGSNGSPHDPFPTGPLFSKLVNRYLKDYGVAGQVISLPGTPTCLSIVLQMISVNLFNSLLLIK